jgi:hypothetical protein
VVPTAMTINRPIAVASKTIFDCHESERPRAQRGSEATSSNTHAESASVHPACTRAAGTGESEAIRAPASCQAIRSPNPRFAELTLLVPQCH